VSTVQGICDRAGRLLALPDSGQSLTPAESADALVALNAMVSSWRNEALTCYSVRDESLTLDGSTTYSIGPSGDLNTDRPIELVGAYVVLSGVSYPCRLIEAAEYAAIPVKATTADFPTEVYYQPTMPTGTLYPYPIPPSGTLHLLTRTPVSTFALTDTVSLPPGWEDALAYNLAVAIASEYMVQPSPLVVKMAATTKGNIKRANARPLAVSSDLARMIGRGRPNILTN
jgi:hypothetical protein